MRFLITYERYERFTDEFFEVTEIYFTVEKAKQRIKQLKQSKECSRIIVVIGEGFEDSYEESR